MSLTFSCATENVECLRDTPVMLFGKGKVYLGKVQKSAVIQRRESIRVLSIQSNLSVAGEFGRLILLTGELPWTLATRR